MTARPATCLRRDCPELILQPSTGEDDVSSGGAAGRTARARCPHHPSDLGSPPTTARVRCLATRAIRTFSGPTIRTSNPVRPYYTPSWTGLDPWSKTWPISPSLHDAESRAVSRPSRVRSPNSKRSGSGASGGAHRTTDATNSTPSVLRTQATPIPTPPPPSSRLRLRLHLPSHPRTLQIPVRASSAPPSRIVVASPKPLAATASAVQPISGQKHQQLDPAC
jgi:hypothetical protein